ncbi:MAG: hypothetical protein JSS14_05125 [Proteobacteria bacterium]|nr:hypothetical protein [Pseudomonadota bacterium]
MRSSRSPGTTAAAGIVSNVAFIALNLSFVYMKPRRARYAPTTGADNDSACTVVNYCGVGGGTRNGLASAEVGLGFSPYLF